ncbi:MAG TPA: TetR/AcrR family transcriptional regulator, partial [Stellaceae bacterium]|nr:TetR/AcrR family transcriptional regulator [Stellaceae bacterium]
MAGSVGPVEQGESRPHHSLQQLALRLRPGQHAHTQGNPEQQSGEIGRVAIGRHRAVGLRRGYGAAEEGFDLAARMGITGASLYNAFGDKRSLFREVLQRYAERSTRERIARLESTLPPKEAVRAFLDEIVERSVDGDRRGCMLVNTALEIAPHDPQLGAEVA